MIKRMSLRLEEASYCMQKLDGAQRLDTVKPSRRRCSNRLTHSSNHDQSNHYQMHELVTQPYLVVSLGVDTVGVAVLEVEGNGSAAHAIVEDTRGGSSLLSTSTVLGVLVHTTGLANVDGTCRGKSDRGG